MKINIFRKLINSSISKIFQLKQVEKTVQTFLMSYSVNDSCYCNFTIDMLPREKNNTLFQKS